MYYLSDNNGNYIKCCNGIAVKTTDISKVWFFETKTKAENVLRSLPRTMLDRDNFIVNAEEISGNPTKIEHVSKINSMLKDIKAEIDSMLVNECEYSKKLSDIDLELSDIDHYIEFFNLSAYDGYLKAKLRQDKLRERRKIKDRIKEIDILKDINFQDTIDKLDAMEKRIYRPRKMPELFVGKKM